MCQVKRKVSSDFEVEMLFFFSFFLSGMTEENCLRRRCIFKRKITSDRLSLFYFFHSSGVIETFRTISAKHEKKSR